MITSVFSWIYRRRAGILAAAVVLTLGSMLVAQLLPQGDARSATALVPLVSSTLIVLCLFSMLVAARQRSTTPLPPLRVAAPVAGRWLAMNSPATKIPSHGVRAYGQAYAIDLVHEPIDRERPLFGSGAGMRSSHEFPAFGQSVFAMTSGTVVAASDGQRDHRSRSTLLAALYMLVEGAVRELGGPRFIVGNHVTIRSHDGTFALIAHLRQGSLLVSVGDTVHSGQQLAQCGNSGNSSEPHVHAQLMDRQSLWTAQGLPMAFTDVTISPFGDEPELHDAIPANGQHMIAGLHNSAAETPHEN